MLTIHKTSAVALALLLMTVLPVASPAQEPRPPDERERERRESGERRAREILEAQERLLQEERERSELRELEPGSRLTPHGIEGRKKALWTLLEAWGDRSRVAKREGRLPAVAGLPEEIKRLHREEHYLHQHLEELERGKRFDELDQARAELDRVRHQIREHEEHIARILDRERQEAQQQHLQTMVRRLEYVSNLGEVAFDAQRAVMMATQAIVELGLAGDAPGESAGVLEELLEQVKELGSRTAIRFALKNLYMKMDRPSEAHDQMVQVILENAHGISPRPPRPAGQGRQRQGHERPPRESAPVIQR